MSDTKNGVFHTRNTSSDVLLSDFKKTEQLSAGLYMVTHLISDTEPIKRILREKSLLLLSDMTPLRDVSIVDRTTRLRRAEDTVAEIVTLLHVAYAGDLISEMNMRLLKEEYLVLHTELEKGMKVLGVTDRALTALFERDVPADSQPYAAMKKRSGAYEEKGKQIKGHIKDTEYNVSDKGNMSDRVLYNSGEHHHTSGHMRTEKDLQNSQQSDKKINKKKETSAIDFMMVKDKRKKQILSVIKKKGRVAIKDITSAVTDTSEKTLQRTLAALVKEGVLKKEGEKRWSVYSLK